LLHRAIALQIRQNMGCYIFTLLPLRSGLCASVKICLCPAFTHEATIVLPDFARSCSNDVENLTQPSPRERALKNNPHLKRVSALTTRAGRRKGGNDGLAFWVM